MAKIATAGRDESRVAPERAVNGYGRDYRERIYRFYLDARNQQLAPDSIDGLGPRAAHLERLVRKYFPLDRDAPIIDLGCGYGALIHFARRAGYRNVMGVDCSLQQVRAAELLGIDKIGHADLNEALQACADSSIDAVVTFDVIEHLHKEELTVFADEVCRVLRSGGRWIIHVPNGESPLGSRMRYWDFTHELAFTRESIAQLALSSGFSRLECHDDPPAVHGVKSAVRWLMWRGLCAGLHLWLAIETGDYDRDAIFSQNLYALAIK